MRGTSIRTRETKVRCRRALPLPRQRSPTARVGEWARPLHEYREPIESPSRAYREHIERLLRACDRLWGACREPITSLSRACRAPSIISEKHAQVRCGWRKFCRRCGLRLKTRGNLAASFHSCLMKWTIPPSPKPTKPAKPAVPAQTHQTHQTHQPTKPPKPAVPAQTHQTHQTR